MFNTLKKKIFSLLAVVAYVAGIALSRECFGGVLPSSEIDEEGTVVCILLYIVSMLLFIAWISSCNQNSDAYRLPLFATAVSFILGGVFFTRYAIYDEAASVMRYHSSGTQPDWYFDYSSSEISEMQYSASEFADNASTFLTLAIIFIVVGVICSAVTITKAKDQQ